MNVGEAMTLEVEYVAPGDNVQRAAELLRDLGVGLVPVVEREAVVGVVGERDLAVNFVAEGLDYSGTTVADVMTRELPYVYEDDDAAEARRQLDARGLPLLLVLDREHKLVGIVSRGDLLRPRPQGPRASGYETPRRRSTDVAGVDPVSGLIMEELSAVESYRHAAGRLHGRALAELRRLENEHEKAAALLQQAVADRGVEPPLTAGARGVWARVREAAAGLLGDSAALEALKAAEEDAARDYERALQDPALPADVRALIRTQLLPASRAHVPALDEYLRGRGPSGSSYNADQGYGPAGDGRGVA